MLVASGYSDLLVEGSSITSSVSSESSTRVLTGARGRFTISPAKVCARAIVVGSGESLSSTLPRFGGGGNPVSSGKIGVLDIGLDDIGFLLRSGTPTNGGGGTVRMVFLDSFDGRGGGSIRRGGRPGRGSSSIEAMS